MSPLSSSPLGPTPQVSVIVPTYNNARFLPQALESVFSQNYDPCELIVVDDGSVDDTRHLLQAYADRIRYVYQQNAGSAAARNVGLELARGEFIVFLDADDLLLPWKLRQQAANLKMRPELGIIHSGWQLIDEFGAVIQEVRPWQYAPSLDLATWLRYKPVKMGAMMFRRLWLERVGGLDTALRQSHDVDLLLRLALAGCQAEWIYKPTMCYRHHPRSTIRLNAREHSRFVTLVLDKFFDHPQVPNELRQRETATRYFSAAWLAWHMYRSGFLAETVDSLQQSLHYSSQLPIRTVFDWLKHFTKWSLKDGSNTDDLRRMWPYFRAALTLDEGVWQQLEPVLDWWLLKFPFSDDHPYGSLGQLSLLFQQICECEAAAGMSVKLIIAWWTEVWSNYLNDDALQAAQGLHSFPSLTEHQLIELAQLSIILDPIKINLPRITQFWQDVQATRSDTVTGKGPYTSLLLTYSGQMFLRKRWYLVTAAIWKTLFMGAGNDVRRAWALFLRAGWQYFQKRRFA